MKKLSTFIFTIALAVTLTNCSKPSEISEEELIANTLDAGISSAKMEAELFDLINAHRTSIGANALIHSSEVYSYAHDHNSYMISQNKLSHDNFDSRAAKITAQTSASNIAENVARHYDSVQSAMDEWLKSSSHKTTIEGNYTHSTLSIVLDKEGKPYFTQIFILVE